MKVFVERFSLKYQVSLAGAGGNIRNSSVPELSLFAGVILRGLRELRLVVSL